MFYISSVCYCFISLCLILFQKAHRIGFFQISMRLSTIWGNMKWNLPVIPTKFFLMELKEKKKTWIKKSSVPEIHNTGFLRLEPNRV